MKNEPVGYAEIAAKLGVEPKTVRQWRWRGVLPDEQWTVNGQPAWAWSTIVAWCRRTGRTELLGRST